MDDAANLWEGEKQAPVGRRVRGRIELAFDALALEVDEHDVVRRQRVVGDAARLDGEDAALAVQRARVAEGEIDEAVPLQGDVRLVSLALELFQHDCFTEFFLLRPFPNRRLLPPGRRSIWRRV